MTARSKAEIKTFFETGDQPTQAQFEDLIDSFVDKNGPIGTLETAASGGGTGYVAFAGGTPSIASYSSLITQMGLTVYTTAQAVAAVTSADGNVWYGTQQWNNNASFAGRTLFPDDGRRTISTSAGFGFISLLGSNHTIETQGSAATDDLDQITSTGSGAIVFLRAESDDRTVVLRHNTSNIYVPNALSVSLDTAYRYVGLIYDSDLAKHIVLFDGTTKEYVDSVKVTLGTSQSASGSAVNFTGLPSGIKRLTMNLVGVSTNGLANLITQIGDSGGLETSGYLGATSFISVTTPQSTNYTNGINLPAAATSTFHGQIVFELVDASTFTWTASVNVSTSDAARGYWGGYSKSLTGELTQISITTTDTFDAGTINIQYEL